MVSGCINADVEIILIVNLFAKTNNIYSLLIFFCDLSDMQLLDKERTKIIFNS